MQKFQSIGVGVGVGEGVVWRRRRDGSTIKLLDDTRNENCKYAGSKLAPSG